MGPGDYTIDFTGLCLVHVKRGSSGGRTATAYCLRAGDHCSKLLFPLDALADEELPQALAPADVIDVPGQPLYLAVDITGYRASFATLPANNIVANSSTTPAWPVNDWGDLGNVLDLKYISEEATLKTAVLEANARAIMELPDGDLKAVEPVDEPMKNQPWNVFNQNSSRKQGVSDRIRLTFRNSGGGGGVKLKLVQTEGGDTVELNFDDVPSGVRLGVSSLCTFTKKLTGMPDVPDYAALVVPKTVREPEEADQKETPNASRCPPMLFIES